MTKLLLSALVMFSGLTALAAETRVLGNVVAEERTFTVDFNDCLKVFKMGAYASHCTYIDPSIKFPETDLALGDLPYVSEKILTGGRETSINVTLAARKDGWQAVFSLDGEATSKAISADQAKIYFARLSEKVNGQLKVLVYTAK